MKKKIVGVVILVLLVLIIVFSSINNKDNCNHNGYTITELTKYFNYTLNTEDCPFKIAILDTGVDPEIISAYNIEYFKDFVNGSDDVYDDDGHGTKIANIICGSSNNNSIGINNTLKLIILKTIDKNSFISYSALLDSLDWLIENYKEQGIRIVCMSFGFDNISLYEDDNLVGRIEKLTKEGLIFITSSGNNGKDGSVTFPGLLNNVITVGSVNYEPGKDISIYSAERSVFTSFDVSHNKPDYYAPGENIIFNTECKNEGCGHEIVSGTSFSAAIVCGEIATLLQQKQLSSDELYSYLKATSINSILNFESIGE